MTKGKFSSAKLTALSKGHQIKNSPHTQLTQPITKPNYRKDIVSQNLFPKAELLRIVKQRDGSIILDWHQNLPGHGAYVFKNAESWNKMKQKNLLARAFKTPVDAKVYEILQAEWENGPK